VPQILNPVVLVIDEMPKLYRDPKLAAYINATYGSCEGAQKAILTDFCRHAFDGSGADVSRDWGGGTVCVSGVHVFVCVRGYGHVCIGMVGHRWVGGCGLG
jgi:hypothetical protein